MIDRREWLKRSLGGGLAAAAGVSWNRATAQEPNRAAAKAKYEARRPTTLDSDRQALRPALEPWEARLANDPQIERLLELVRAEHKLPGMIGGIIKGPALVAIGATGVRRLGGTDPFQITDQIHLGSCTKAMTATLLGILFERRMLNPSSALAEVFPEYAERMHPDFKTVTLSHLLTHRAGLPHDAANWRRLPGRTPTEKRYAALEELTASRPTFKPGTKHGYSNAGYVLAGLMAEQVTGVPWEVLIRQEVFTPLNMFSAGFGPPGEGSSGESDQPYGHHLVHGKVEPIRYDNAPCMGPAGTVHCTMADWAKFAILHLRGERDGSRILRRETLRDLHTPPRGTDCASGWFVFSRPWAGGRALTHSGSNTYWYATIWLAPARDFGLLVATNQGGDPADKACDQAIGALIRHREAAFPG